MEKWIFISQIKSPPLVCSPANSLKFPVALPKAISVLRPYSPGGPLNGFPTTWKNPLNFSTTSGHRLQLGLPGYLIPFAPLAFVPHRQIRSSQAPLMTPSFGSAFLFKKDDATGSPARIIGFYPYPSSTLDLSRSQAL